MEFLFLAVSCSGNDFLPHMPTLDIREGAIELMMRVYKGMLPRLGGYLCHGSTINLARAEQFIQVLDGGRFISILKTYFMVAVLGSAWQRGAVHSGDEST